MNIQLKQLRLENFKCHKALKLDFGGKDASIYGDNATGKTSVYDALTWLLFGKDSAGNGEKNIEIKPLAPDGSVKDHQAITEVEAVLLADGEEITLRRTYQELWSTKRGSAEATYDGNTSEYFVDGVPCKANAYKARVAELVNEEQFRLLTTVSYFPDKLPWQKRREALFSLFGALTDLQIMETDQRFTPLMQSMGKLTLADFKKVVTQKRKGFMATRDEVPARISECEKTIQDLGELDFDMADAQISVLNARRERLREELLAIENNTAARLKKVELQQAKMELDKMETENRMFRRNQEAAAPDISGLDRMLRQRKELLSSEQDALSRLRVEVDRCKISIAEKRENWKAVNGEKFSGSETCPTCGQRLPVSAVYDAAQRFGDDKKQRLNALVVDSNDLKERMARFLEQADRKEKAIRELEAEIGRISEKIAAEKSSAETVVISDMDGYSEKRKAIQAWISGVQAELDNLQLDYSMASADLRQKISAIQAEISELSQISGKRSALDYARRRIEELREDAQAAADNLSGLDKLLYLMEQFSRYKASFVEEGINNEFRLAKFRLFREQANGGVEDRCDVVYDGVPYLGLNNGMKINVGIDIINTLSRAYGVTVPLFIDNAESVTNLEKADCQVIRLVVSEKDKELRLENG